MDHVRGSRDGAVDRQVCPRGNRRNLIRTNDLTMLILGIDRDDASIQEIYDERNLAVLRAMSHVIRILQRGGCYHLYLRASAFELSRGRRVSLLERVPLV